MNHIRVVQIEIQIWETPEISQIGQPFGFRSRYFGTTMPRLPMQIKRNFEMNLIGVPCLTASLQPTNESNWCLKHEFVADSAHCNAFH
jgi:hypothetical protein